MVDYTRALSLSFSFLVFLYTLPVLCVSSVFFFLLCRAFTELLELHLDIPPHWLAGNLLLIFTYGLIYYYIPRAILLPILYVI